jgi:N-acyl-D-amino-acid deacylase
MPRNLAAFVFVQVAVASAGGPPAVNGQERFDLLVRGGTVADGTSTEPRPADVGIRGGRIARVGALSDARADRVIDAAGLVVAPGFIDVHTHADDLAERPGADNFVRMGLTTIVAGNCGSSTVNVAETLDRIRSTGAALNFATLVGHGSVRAAVMGTERRAPTEVERRRMEALVEKAMTEGAVGLSTGLQYVPGTYAETDEIVALARVAAAGGGLYASHMRNEGTAIDAAVAEAIAVGEAARCPVQISHLKIDSPRHWGASGRVLATLEAARARGVDVRADQYAYTAGSSSLGIRFPAWALEGGQDRIRERLDDAATWARIRTEMKGLLEERGFRGLDWAVVAKYAPEPAWNGLSIAALAAKTRGSDSLDDQLETARLMLRAGGAQMVYHFMSEEDLERILRHPDVMVASDGSVVSAGEGQPHPRSYGNNARVLGRYVRERKTLSLAEAVRKMTALPAQQFGFRERGLVKEGQAADLVVFDPKLVDDAATYESPHQAARGIVHVMVNGVPVILDGRPTGARPGQVLSSSRRRATARSSRHRGSRSRTRPAPRGSDSRGPRRRPSAGPRG